jgi:PAS domain S-box-containing protein
MTQNHSNSSFDDERLRRTIWTLLIVVFVGLIVVRGTYLWHRHHEVLLETQRHAENLVHILSENLTQRIATVDAALSQLRLHSERIGGPNAQPPFWDPVLQAAFSGLSGVGSLSILNDDGIISHSTIYDIVGQSRADLFLFQYIKSNQPGGLIADTPFRSPIGRGIVLPIGRMLAGPGGEFQGIVVAALEPEQLRGFFRSVDIGTRGRVMMLHPEGAVLFQEPASASTDAKMLDHPLLALAQNDADRGFIQGPLDPDGPSYFTAVQMLWNPRLLLAVSLDEDSALAAWRRELLLSIAVIAAMGFVLLTAGYLINREIQARAAADKALKANQARFDEIMYNAPMLVSVKDPKGRVKFINRELEKLFDTTANDALGKTLHDIVSIGTGPADLIANLDRQVVETKTPVQREMTYATKDGMRTALFVKFPMFDSHGDVEAVVSFSTDLTEQKRAANWFKTIMDHAPASVVLKDLDGRYLFANRALEQWLGVKSSELIGKTSADFFPTEYAAAHDAFDREVMETQMPLQREFLAPFSSGQRTVLFLKFPIFDANGQLEGVGSIGTDISDQKQAEAHLAQAQRMEAVGQLTGGIAHDFNNLLTVIIGNSELLTSELRRNERLYPLAEVTLDAAERGAALTQRLLAFGRRQMLEPKATDIKLLIEDMEPLIARATSVSTRIDVRSGDDLWPAMVDPVQLETAILNLVVNSRDAMPNGGRISIEVSNAEIDEDYRILNPDAKPGDYVMIAVSDTGTGMPPEVVARVFEPFFTTKEVGKGTGLGLPTIYGFVKQSGGHVKIYSEVGHGTVVRLYLPRALSPSLVPNLRADSMTYLPGGRERILLVEDDAIVRTHTEFQLRELGYHVTTASGPDDAIKIARLTGRPDLLLTDVVMPGTMNGRNLALRMREIWPDLPVICTSGYTDGLITDLVDGMSEGMHFLAKPFRRRDLAFKIREAIETPVRTDA